MPSSCSAAAARYAIARGDADDEFSEYLSEAPWREDSVGYAPASPESNPESEWV